MKEVLKWIVYFSVSFVLMLVPYWLGFPLFLFIHPLIWLVFFLLVDIMLFFGLKNKKVSTSLILGLTLGALLSFYLQVDAIGDLVGLTFFGL